MTHIFLSITDSFIYLWHFIEEPVIPDSRVICFSTSAAGVPSASLREPLVNSLDGSADQQALSLVNSLDGSADQQVLSAVTALANASLLRHEDPTAVQFLLREVS